MKCKAFQVVALFWVLAVALPLVAAPPVPAIVLPITCVRAIDGDTVDVDVTLRVRVRLLNCWAPEKNTSTGKAAADSLKLATSGAGGETVEGVLQIPIPSMELQDWFTFGRVLGNVTINGQTKSLGEQQIALGLASSKKNGVLGQ